MAVREDLIAHVGVDTAGFERGMSRMGRVARKFSTSMVRWGKRGAIAVAGIGVASAVVGAKFEDELMKTATVAGAFGKDLDALRDKARELGATTAFTATQAATGMYDLASAGMNTKQILAATEHAMKLAGATGSEMSQATGLLAASLKQFNLEAEESQRVVDVYAQAITSSQLTMERLTEAMKYAGTTGAALGWSIEETTAAVAQFANLGLEGSMAGTNLRMSMITLSKQSKNVTRALGEMGLTFADVNPETHTFGEILKTIGEHSMTTEQAVALFGARAGLNMKQLAQLAVTGQQDFAGFVEQLKKGQEGAGRASEMYGRMMETFLNKFKVVISALQDLGIEIFYTFESAGKDAFEIIAGKLNEISAWVKDHQEEMRAFFGNLVEAGQAIIPIVVAIAKGFWKVGDAIGWAVAKAVEIYEKIERFIGMVKKQGVAKFLLKFVGHGSSEAPLSDKIKELTWNIEEFERIAGRDITKNLSITAQSGTESPRAVSEELQRLRDRVEELEERAVSSTRAPEKYTEEYQKFGGDIFTYGRREREELTVGGDIFEKLKYQHERALAETEAFYGKQEELIRSNYGRHEKLSEVHAQKERIISKRTKEFEFKMQMERLNIAQRMTSGLSNIAETLYTSGLVQSKKMFKVMKAFKMAEAVIAGHKAVMEALASPYPWPLPQIFAGIAAAMAAVQIAAIAAQQPPAYQYGGVVRSSGPGGQIVRVAEAGDEAIVPLRDGGVPVAWVGGAGQERQPTVVEEHYHFEGATFLDQATLAATMDSIAVRAVKRSYDNDGTVRRIVRGRA